MQGVTLNKKPTAEERNMIGEFDPIEGNWYHNIGKEQNFMVVVVSETGGTVDIQYFDGDLEELEMEEWEEMDLEEIEPPEDWTGPLDKLEPDDLGYE
jgi:Family of unknown function (DUF6763)